MYWSKSEVLKVCICTKKCTIKKIINDNPCKKAAEHTVHAYAHP